MSNLVKVLSLRNMRLASLNGMCVHIPANETTEIPACLLHEALALGCIPAEQSDVEALREAQVAADDMQLERDEAIAAGIAQLVELNDSGDFSPTGVPRITSLRAVLSDETVTAKERDEVWAASFTNLT